MESSPRKRTDWVRAAALGVLILLTWLLWRTPVVFPMKILTVLFHELSHGFAAILTGGRILGIELSVMEGGQCITAGGWRFIVVSAGYLGSLLWGGLLLLATRWSRRDRILSGLLGAFLLFVAFWWIRPLVYTWVLWILPIPSFSLAFVLLAAIALLLCARFLSHAWNEFILTWIGLTSILYVPFDILDDTVFRTGVDSDADMLGDLTWMPGWVWGIGWALVAFVAAGYFLYLATRVRKDAAPASPLTDEPSQNRSRS